MSKDLMGSILPLAAGVGLASITGGASAPLTGAGALGGEAAMAGATANTLGAGAGLLSGAGTAPSLGIGASGIAGGAGAIGGDVASSPVGLFGPNNEYVGQTIGSELTPNAYTGGYDSLNGLERIGQRVGGFMDDGGFDKLGKMKSMFGGQQQPQQPQAQNKEISGGAVQQPQQEPQPMTQVYGQPQIQLTDEQRRMMMARGLL